MQAAHSRKPAQDTAGLDPSSLLDLFLCVAGFVVASAGKPRLDMTCTLWCSHMPCASAPHARNRSSMRRIVDIGAVLEDACKHVMVLVYCVHHVSM